MDTTETPAAGMLVAEAAALWGISADAVRKRAYRGALESYKVDGRLYVVVPANGRHSAPRDDGRHAADGMGQDMRLQAALAELAVVKDERDYLRGVLMTSIVTQRQLAERLAVAERQPAPWWRQLIARLRGSPGHPAAS